VKPLNIKLAKPPIVFSAAEVKFLTNFPDGPDKLWSAKISARRYDVQADDFADVLFVESPLGERSLVYVYGIEAEDGYPQGLRPDLARKQQAFIKFLRDENAKDDEVLGWTANLFSGSQYACIYKATAAFLSASGVQANIGVSCRDEQRKYQLVALEPEAEDA